MLKIKLKCRITHLAGIVDHVYVKYFLTIILKMINHLLLLLIISDSVIDWLSYLICYSNHLNSILRSTTLHSLILTLIPTENRLSLCHINIRSLQANLHSFEKYLENIDIKFSCVGVTDTWLQDHNCDLYNLNGYELIENHRQTRRGGGVGMYLKEDIPYLTRSDIVLPDGII